MAELFDRIIEFSVYGAFWLLVLFLACFICRKKAGALWQYVIMLCIAVHLLIPVHMQWMLVEVPFLQEKMQQLPEERKTADAGEKNLELPEDVKTADRKAAQSVSTKAEALNTETTKTASAETEDALGRNNMQDPDSVQTPTMAADAPKGGTHIPLMTIARYLWILGMLFYFGKIAISYAVFCRQAKRWSLPADSLAHEMFLQEAERCGIRRQIHIRRNSKIHSPLLYGIFHPVILLPDEEYSRQEYQYIFRHELCHYRHGDVCMKYVFTLCKGVYWFHLPLRWMCHRAYMLMEILCDDSVVAGTPLEERRAYGRVILRHMSMGISSGTLSLAAGFYGGKDDMKMRFKNILGTTKRKAGAGAVLAAVLVALVLGGVKWGAASTEVPPEANALKEGKAENGSAQKMEDSHQTIAVIGTDGKSFADAFLLVDLNSAEGTISVENVQWDFLIDYDNLVASLPEEQRDSLMPKEIGGFSSASISYGYGVLVGAIERTYDVEVDSHIVLDYKTVQSLIDAVGGVSVTLTQEEADALASSELISKKENKSLKAGTQTLNGEQALAYMRAPFLDADNTAEENTGDADTESMELQEAMRDADASLKELLEMKREADAWVASVMGEDSADINREEIWDVDTTTEGSTDDADSASIELLEAKHEAEAAMDSELRELPEEIIETGISDRTERCTHVLSALLTQVRNQQPDWEKIRTLLQEGAILEMDISMDDLILIAKQLVSGELEIISSEKYPEEDF